MSRPSTAISSQSIAGGHDVLRWPVVRRSLAALCAVGCIGGAVSAVRFESASAQPNITLTNGADLRVLYANAEDIAEGKRIAASSCAGCHGANGVSTSAGVPHLAGQRPAYLYLELKAYQSGVRGASAMKNAVAYLSDDALMKVAAYYASLDPAPSNPRNGAAVDAADPVKVGQSASSGCAGCHGDAGVTKTPGFPSLVGLDPKYLVTAMKAYNNGQRNTELMKAMVASLSDGAINDIALYYALQTPARAQTPAEGDKAAGAAAAAVCAGCHGADGVSGNPQIPSIAGQDATYLATAMLAYKQGSRRDETMKGLVASLDDKAIKNLAAHYASLEPKQPNVRKPLTADEWAQRCDRCHGINGNSSDPRLPALAGQRLDYLEKVLRDYQTGTRKSPQMAAMSEVLTEDDVRNLAAHYARQTARAVVYVTMPPK